jgi:hypothetical protein
MTKAIWILVLFLSLAFPAHAQLKENLLPTAINPLYHDYVWDFIYRSHGKVTFLDFQHIILEPATLEYSEKHEGIIGMCHWGFMTRNRIEIDSLFFETHSSIKQWELLFHELGHCICNRPHPDLAITEHWIVGVLNKIGINHVRWSSLYLHDGCPSTIMYPYDLTEQCLKAHQEYYVQEMFEHCNPTPAVLLMPYVPGREQFKPDRI